MGFLCDLSMNNDDLVSFPKSAIQHLKQTPNC